MSIPSSHTLPGNMGHANMVSTDYYLHLVPEFFHTFAEKVRSTEGVLPEVDYEGE